MSSPSRPLVRTGPDLAELTRKTFTEFLGSVRLAATVVGSGIAAQRLSPNETGPERLANALITGAVLVALILTRGPVSAAFNPVVTLAERACGAITTKAAAVFVSTFGLLVVIFGVVRAGRGSHVANPAISVGRMLSLDVDTLQHLR